MGEMKIQYGRVEKYSSNMVFHHWVIIIFIALLLITGGLPFFNWFLLELNIHNVSLPVLPYSLYLHIFFGIIFIFIIISYLSEYVKDDDHNIFSEDSEADLKSFVDSVKYTVGLSRQRESGEGEKFLKSQRVLYILFVFAFGLLFISGCFMVFESIRLRELVEPSLLNAIFMTHIISMVMILLLALIFIGTIVRKFDKVAIKSLLLSGKVPMWYIKKYHKSWFWEITKEEEKPKSD